MNKKMSSPQTNFELSKDNCVSFLVRLVEEKCKGTLPLQDAEMINRGIRHLKGQKQFIPSHENELDETKSVELLFKGVLSGHSNNVLTLDEGSIAYYCIQYLQNHFKETLPVPPPSSSSSVSKETSGSSDQVDDSKKTTSTNLNELRL